MNRILRDSITLLSILAIIWISLTLLIRGGSQDYGAKREFSILSEENQIKIATALKNSILTQYDTLSIPEVNNAIDSIKQRLTKGTDEEYNIYILQDSTVNAFATLQGDIYIFSGLIEFSPTPEMLAAVIAHEMGHIKEKHFISRMSKQIGLQAAILIFTGGDPGTITQLSQNLLNMQYSRKQEDEADRFALERLEKAQLNPQNLTRFFVKLSSASSIPKNQFLELFMTHPSLPKRIVEATSYKPENDFQPHNFQIDWQNIQRLVSKK